ncbi:hypothetical protein BHE90_010188 [Fusarium euwallaceae]|uniref:Uncharacterized protein n=2 Tax=Fusarium solani species complex TaxID=232080 RepID=A0A430LI33_9HYPO|nr:hypothetical protein CEP51_004310 [Fusarium floridanum]RTE75357.1 hypothetical protein BHE90_010188 [Fusarium euwallaceae]
MVSFERQELDTDKNNDDFFSDAKIGVQPVVASGQTVYWQRCTIRVFETGKETEQPIERVAQCDGQAFLKRGISLIFEKGKIKEV